MVPAHMLSLTCLGLFIWGTQAVDTKSLISELERLLQAYDTRDIENGVVDSSTPSIANGNLQERPLRLAAFNIRIFGLNKIKNENATRAIVELVTRYDIVLIQEIRDASGTAIIDLLVQINRASNNGYSMVVSDRLGRSTSKEQYAYIYRKTRLEVIDTYQYPASFDKFERPPFCVLVSTDALETMTEFVLIGIHTAPGKAEFEINELSEVYDKVAARWNIEDAFLLGDFNADCSYVTSSEWPSISLWTQPRFLWLIDNSADTTTTVGSHCAYDRIVVAGSKAQQAVVTASASVYPYDAIMHLTQSEALEISDHYPVEVDLHGKVNPAVKDRISLVTSFRVESATGTDPYTVPSLAVVYRTRNGYRVKRNGDTLVLTACDTTRDEVVPSLRRYVQTYPDLMTNAMVDLVRLNIDSGLSVDTTARIPGLHYAADPGYTIEIKYDLFYPFAYKIQISCPIFVPN